MSGVQVFDAVAAGYDRAEAANPIVGLLRARNLGLLERTFPAGSRLLDIGAGTGTDAVALSLGGRRVVAVDPSMGMLEVLTAKAAAAHVKVATHRLTAGDLNRLPAGLGFDGAYSSFGALNCEPDLAPVAAALARLIRPGGCLVLSLMSRWALTEIAGLVAAGRPRQAFRRAGGEAAPAVGGHATRVHYHSVPQVQRALGPAFRLEREAALGLLLPPPSAWARLGPGRRLLPALAAADGWLGGIRPLSRLGDHVLLSFRRAG